MYALFIALFGIIYYACRFSSDKKVLDSIKKDKIRRESWVNAVTDRKLEDEVWEYLNNPQNASDVYKEIADVYSCVVACKGLSEKDIQRDIYMNKGYNDMIFRILMARRGKVTHMDAVSYIDAPKLYKRREYTETYKYRFEGIMIWYVKELRKHGLFVPLMYERYEPMSYKQNGSKYVEVEKVPMLTEERFGGRYIWKGI